MNSTQIRWLVVALIALLGIGFAVVWFGASKPATPMQTRQPSVVSPAPLHKPAELPPEVKPLQQQPMPEVVEEPVLQPTPMDVKKTVTPEPISESVITNSFSFSLPELDESDQPLLAQLKHKVTEKSLALLVDDGLIERFVVTVDSIAKGQVPYNLLPVKRPYGRYKTIEVQDHYYPSTANIARYQPYLELMLSMPADSWGDFYRHIYPLVQQSYERLGYGKQEFHSVLLAAIERLLATPKPTASVALVQPNVMYEYADRELQQNSTQLDKLMLRLGPDVNAKLRKLLWSLKQEL